VNNFKFRPLYLGENPGIDCIGGYVGSRNELDVSENRKSLPLPGFESQFVEPIAKSP
jgi:hypothetical protein